jgi:arsenate reductase
MKKIYYLSTCSTCNRIIKELDLDPSFELQDIKANKITNEQIEEMQKMSGSYESLFSKRAVKYKAMGLKELQLSEPDIKKLIQDEYTFLKRPVIIYHDSIFVGNAKKTIEAAKLSIHNGTLN